MANPRYLARFENTNGSVVITFPLNAYEYESTQALSNDSVPVAGANYEARLLGALPAPKGNGIEVLRFIDVQDDTAALDTDVDLLKTKLVDIGMGKLWTVGADASERWAWGVVSALPSLRLAVENKRHMPVLANFTRFSDWFGPDGIEQEENFESVSTVTFSLNNPGSAMAYAPRITLKGPYVGPVTVTNETTGDAFTSSHSNAGSGDWLRVDAGSYRVELSGDSGSSYANDYASFSLPDGQTHFMRLASGANIITVDLGGTSTGAILFQFEPPFH